MKTKKPFAIQIVDAIWDEIYGRSGGDHFLDACGDEEISNEIYDALVERVKKVLRTQREPKK